jgi:hypothetical protein
MTFCRGKLEKFPILFQRMIHRRAPAFAFGVMKHLNHVRGTYTSQRILRDRFIQKFGKRESTAQETVDEKSFPHYSP